jgi:hypothetical protein
VQWAGVPPAIFDAAEDTVGWLVEATASGVNAVVSVELLGSDSPAGIAVRLRSGDLGGEGVLDGRGQSRFPLLDAQHQLVTESAAWNHDWQDTRVVVGADVDESAQTRDRVRAFARARVMAPAGDAFLAEILAAESDY